MAAYNMNYTCRIDALINVLTCDKIINRAINAIKKIDRSTALVYYISFVALCHTRLIIVVNFRYLLFTHSVCKLGKKWLCINLSVLHIAMHMCVCRNFTFDGVHVEGAQRLARIARESGVEKFIHVSHLNAQPHPPSKFVKGGSKYLKSKVLVC